MTGNVAARASLRWRVLQGAYGAASVFALSAVAAAACSSTSPHPNVLGDCVPTSDAANSCSGLSSGGGNTGPMDGGSSSQDSGIFEEASSCGTAGELINTANTACLTCIETSCCLAAAACTGPCLSIVQCPSGSINSCASTYSGGLASYDDFAACISQSCGGSSGQGPCPALPVATGPDI